MSDPVLQLRGIRRDYASGARMLEVLKGADLDVYPGELVGLIGPSGSGKSSLLHAAGLLERPTAGQVFLRGQDCSRLNDKARSRVRLATLGFVYQFHHLLAELSAEDNIALPLMISGHSGRSARERALSLLTELGLGDRAHHQPAQLSGGEQQRVAIARAMANRPKVILADEPTGNLDPVTSLGVFQTFHELAREQGAAALIATHNMELARYMDRVFALKDGRLVAHKIR
jgi:lipoprotein-releasing system ATP-binding protein